MTAAAARIALVAHRDARGELGERVELLIDGLREIADRIVLVADSLGPDARARAESVADRVVVAPVGSALALIAAGLASVADELRDAASVLVTDTERYGPCPRGLALAQIVAQRAPEVGAWIWAETAPRQELEPSPWIWADREAVASETWRSWWRGAREDRGARGLHELVTALRRAGIPVAALHTAPDERIERLTLERPESTPPFIERLLLTADPLALEEQALRSREASSALRLGGYSMAVVGRDVHGAVPPRQAATSLGALAILGRRRERAGAGLRVAALTHIYHPESLAALQLALQDLPPETTWIITTGSEAAKAIIERDLEEHALIPGPREIDVRVVASNRGRDVSAFLIACADILRPGPGGSYPHDVVLKLHSKRSPQDPYARAQAFQHHVVRSLTGSLAELLQLFVDEPELGMAMPPQIHVGYPTLGRAWFGNRPEAERLAGRLGIDVPFDDGSPLATFGSMFAARPAALRPLVDALGWQDFPDESGYRDGGVAHAVERLFAYAAISEGYTVRTVTTAEIAAESHQLLEWKLQTILEDVPGTSRQQVQLARVATRAAAVPAGAVVRAARSAGRLRGGLARGARDALGRLRGQDG